MPNPAQIAGVTAKAAYMTAIVTKGLSSRMRYLPPAFAVLPLLASPALAQQAEENADEAETVIVVTGEGLPQTPAAPAYSTVEIDRDAIITSASGRLEDVLAGVAGFQQFRRSDSRSANPSAHAPGPEIVTRSRIPS